MKIALQVVAVAVLWASGAAMTAAQESPARIPPPPLPPIIEPIVYFDPGSDVYLRPKGFDVVSRLAHLFPAPDEPHFFVVRGQTDTAGSEDYNRDLSRRRAVAVAERLVEAGARPDRIFISACGETILNRPTSDDTAEPLNRFATFNWVMGRTEPWPPLRGCDQTPFQSGQGSR